jgi:hypothetical protein
MRLILATTPSDLGDNAGCDYAIVDLSVDRARTLLELIGELVGRKNKSRPGLVEERHRDASPSFCSKNYEVEDMIAVKPHRVPPVEFPDGDCFMVNARRSIPPKFVQRTANTLLLVREGEIAWVTNPSSRDHLWVITHSVSLHVLHSIAGVGA